MNSYITKQTKFIYREKKKGKFDKLSRVYKKKKKNESKVIGLVKFYQIYKISSDTNCQFH